MPSNRWEKWQVKFVGEITVLIVPSCYLRNLNKILKPPLDANRFLLTRKNISERRAQVIIYLRLVQGSKPCIVNLSKY
jgi:hypothetical protein